MSQSKNPRIAWRRLKNLLTLPVRDRLPVGATPAQVIHRENKWSLLRYTPPEDGPRYQTPVLLVPSLINRHYVLDLMPGKSFAEYLVGQGHDVYIIDWGTPGPEDRYLTFDDICDTYLGRAVRAVARRSEQGKAHVLGYCMGGTLASIYTARRPEHVASLLALAAPVQFVQEGLLAAWTDPKIFDVDALVDGCGNIPWPLMQASFQLLKPTLNMNKATYMVDRAWDDEFLDGFFAIETWANDNVSFPGECYRRYIKELYQQDLLVKGEFALGGRPVRLEDISCPTLTICFKHDHIVPRASAAALHEQISSPDRTILELGGGHVGAVISRKASQGLWPTMSSWWAERDALDLTPDMLTHVLPSPQDAERGDSEQAVELAL